MNASHSSHVRSHHRAVATLILLAFGVAYIVGVLLPF